ncbi:secretory calcium-binding phosphoprotein 9 [Acanthopagrus schlegelii]
MKLLLLTTIVASVCQVNAGGKTLRLLAAAGLLGGNGAPMAGLAGMNGGLVGLNGGLAGMNGGLPNAVIPGMMAGGLNPPMVAGGGAGIFGQPQLAQFAPRLPVYAVPAPVPNVYAVPAVNAIPFMGLPQMAPVNPPQQPLMGAPGGIAQQQPPVQPDPLRRFRRQTKNQGDSLKTPVDTQIPAPTEVTTPTPCDEEGRQAAN